MIVDQCAYLAYVNVLANLPIPFYKCLNSSFSTCKVLCALTSAFFVFENPPSLRLSFIESKDSILVSQEVIFAGKEVVFDDKEIIIDSKDKAAKHVDVKAQNLIFNEVNDTIHVINDIINEGNEVFYESNDKNELSQIRVSLTYVR